MTTIALVTFDEFTDVDLFLPWDLLGRVRVDGWRVNIVGTASSHRSVQGLTVATGAPLASAATADVVLVGSGPGTRSCIKSHEFKRALRLEPGRQLIGSQCSGALILGALGLLAGRSATTYPTAAAELAAMGVDVVNRPLVVRDNVATAGGCMSALYLVTWILNRTVGVEEARRVLAAVAPVGEEDQFVSAVVGVVDDAVDADR